MMFLFIGGLICAFAVDHRQMVRDGCQLQHHAPAPSSQLLNWFSVNAVNGYQKPSTSDIPPHCTALHWGFTGGIKLRYTGLTVMWADK